MTMMALSGKNDYIDRQLNKLWQYCSDVQNGKQICNVQVKQAVDRFLNLSDGYEFQEASFRRFLHFCSFVKIPVGSTFKQFDPEPWQVFYFANIYGVYVKGTDRRKYTKSFLTIARKNGKTTIAVIQAAFHLTNGENINSQNYIVSGSREMANVGLDITKAIITNSPALAKRVEKLQWYVRMVTAKQKSILKVLPYKPEKLNGLKPAFAIIDEMHVMEDAEVLDMLTTGQIGVKNPLVSIITTRGRNSQYYQGTMEDYCKKMLAGELEDESIFALFYTLDNEKEVEDQSMWIKANPNMSNPDILPLRELVGMFNSAKISASNLISFMIFNLNLWYDKSGENFIAKDKLDAGFVEEIPDEMIEGELCFLGIDLSSTKDISSISLVFPPSENHSEFIVKNWNFKTNSIEKRSRLNGIDLTPWIRTGEIREQSSEIIDFTEIYDVIESLSAKYVIEKVMFDKFNAALLINKLSNDLGLVVKDVPQTAKFLNFPTKFVEMLFINGDIKSDNMANKWMFQNVVLYIDTNNNYKPMKNKGKDPIDGVMSTIMALAGYLDTLSHDRLGMLDIN